MREKKTPRVQELYNQRHQIELEQHGDDKKKAIKDFEGGSSGLDEVKSPLPKQEHELPPEHGVLEDSGRTSKQSKLS